MKNIILCLCIVGALPLFGQRKVSTEKGTLFVHWGYNRSYYTKSNLHIVGPGYDLTLAGAVATDRQQKLAFKKYFDITNLSVPQFNLRIGYYYKNKWAFSVGYDHMKYVFSNHNQIQLSGTIDPGIDTVTNWSGTYTGQMQVTDVNTFHYENTNGMNYIRAELTRSQELFAPRKMPYFKLIGNLGLSTGVIVSVNDFNFLGTHNRFTPSLSGYGVSANSSLRFEFFKHFYVQSSLNTGFVHQVKVRTRPNDPSSYARQALGYVEYDLLVGGLFYLKPKKKCDDCPTW